jgi:hypothetical protein
MVSEGTISIKVFTTLGASSPAEIPCQGCALKFGIIIFFNFYILIQLIQ